MVEKVNDQGVIAGGKRIPSADSRVDCGRSCITDRENVGWED